MFEVRDQVSVLRGRCARYLIVMYVVQDATLEPLKGNLGQIEVPGGLTLGGKSFGWRWEESRVLEVAKTGLGNAKLESKFPGCHESELLFGFKSIAESNSQL